MPRFLTVGGESVIAYTPSELQSIYPDGFNAALETFSPSTYDPFDSNEPLITAIELSISSAMSFIRGMSSLTFETSGDTWNIFTIDLTIYFDADEFVSHYPDPEADDCNDEDADPLHAYDYHASNWYRALNSAFTDLIPGFVSPPFVSTSVDDTRKARFFPVDTPSAPYTSRFLYDFFESLAYYNYTDPDDLSRFWDDLANEILNSRGLAGPNPANPDRIAAFFAAHENDFFSSDGKLLSSD